MLNKFLLNPIVHKYTNPTVLVALLLKSRLKKVKVLSVFVSIYTVVRKIGRTHRHVHITGRTYKIMM